jgi:hypothetical protein
MVREIRRNYAKVLSNIVKKLIRPDGQTAGIYVRVHLFLFETKATTLYTELLSSGSLRRM